MDQGIPIYKVSSPANKKNAAKKITNNSGQQVAAAREIFLQKLTTEDRTFFYEVSFYFHILIVDHHDGQCITIN